MSAVAVAVVLFSMLLTFNVGATAMSVRGRAAFAMPQLNTFAVSSLLRLRAAGDQMHRPACALRTNDGPIFWRHSSVVALRGGAREARAGRAMSAVVVANTRGSSSGDPPGNDASEGQESGQSRTKHSGTSLKGDLVDIDARTGQELRRRARGRGRSLAGYVLQENGDWVRWIDGSTTQSTLSPFLAEKKRNGTALRDNSAHSDQTQFVEDASSDAADIAIDSQVDVPNLARQVQQAMGNASNLDLPPLDESLWEIPPSKWLVFSDLHVSRSSLPTCLQVLKVVHDEAMARGAGVIFLGDFWHEKGILRVEMLNSVMREMRTWRLPFIAVPGNHDQSTLNGLEHALTPLAMVMPACRIISEPTVFLDALWMPYCRDMNVVRRHLSETAASKKGADLVEREGRQGHDTAALSSGSALRARGHGVWMDGNLRHEVSAVFCHVDIIGADMSGGVLAQRGLGVEEFPSDLPVYTGHYHNPHSLWGKEGTRTHPIMYVGSQWQTSMSEAHESKRMLLLDASKGWLVHEEVPIHVGRRHFRASSMAHLAAKLEEWAPRTGDRVQVRVEHAPGARQEAETIAMPSGVALEIVEQPATRNGARVPHADTLDPMALLQQYFAIRDTADEDASSPAADNATRVAAQAVLQQAVDLKPQTSQTARDIVFESVEVQGFGSFGFQRAVRYPLNARGVVLVMGRNEDDDCADSNGAGKTTLCMAALWALTGSADVRADGKRLGRKDIVHSLGGNGGVGGRLQDSRTVARPDADSPEHAVVDSEGDLTLCDVSDVKPQVQRRRSPGSASVCLRGTIDGVEFEVRRRMSGGRSDAHSLRLTLGGERNPAA